MGKLFCGEGVNGIEEFVFEGCDFSQDSAASFFEFFSKYNGTIKALLFSGSTFGKHSLDGLFQFIFFSQSVHSLSVLLLRDIPFPSELVAFLAMLGLCEWVVTTHCLSTVSMINCGLEVGRLLPQLVTCDSGFTHLDVSSNFFLEPIPLIRLPISFLDISRCTFTPASLVSLFETLSEISDREIRLSAAQLQGIDDGFYMDVMWTELTTLSALVWDGNPLPIAPCACFCAFLKNQPKLSELSLAGCLSSSDFALAAPLFADLFSGRPFKSVNFANNQVGPALAPVITSLLGRPGLISLDISGTLIGDAAVICILAEKPDTLTTFKFERFGCESAEGFLAVVRGVIADGRITTSEWPAADAAQFSDASEIATEHQNFVARFGGRSNAEGDTKTEKKKVSVKEKGRSRSGSISKNREGLAKWADYDSEVMEMLVECGEILGDDPMDSLLVQVKTETDVPMLMAGLRGLTVR
jgi:hypothetical protein